jgi:hypothetical protein
MPNDIRSLLDLNQEVTHMMNNIREGLGLSVRIPRNQGMLAAFALNYGTPPPDNRTIYFTVKKRDDVEGLASVVSNFNHPITDRVRLEPPVRRSRYELLMLDEDWFAPGVP